MRTLDERIKELVKEAFQEDTASEAVKAQHLLDGARLLYKVMDRIAFAPSEHPDAHLTADELRELARQTLLDPIVYRFIEGCGGKKRGG